MSIQIPRCYDSHIHLLATGIFDREQGLHGLTDPDAISHAHFTDSHRRGEWITSFGWDHHRFPDRRLPRRETLDRLFPDTPVLLSRGDGHACWVNRKALEAANLWKQKEVWPVEFKALAEFDAQGWPVGVLYESAMYFVYGLIPSLTPNQKREAYLRACRIMNRAGYTHARDMECNPGHFQVLKSLDDSGELSLFLEENFNVETISDFPKVLENGIYAKKENSKRIRVLGIKFYLDGALGSQGAWVSEPYHGTQTSGFCLWKPEEVHEMLIKTWEAGLEVSTHALGDRAVHFMLESAHAVREKTGLSGRLNLEHCEIVTDESIALMKGLNVVCHMQPCHWLTDRAWLVEKQPKHWHQSFGWWRLEQNGINVQFGSDTPIEAPSLSSNYEALEDLHAKGVRRPERPWWVYHSHPDQAWGADCSTRIDERGLVLTTQGTESTI